MKNLKSILFVLVALALVLVACGGGTTNNNVVNNDMNNNHADNDMADDDMADAGLPDLGGREVTIAIENAYLPFNYVSLETGEPGGWDYDVLDEMCARLNCVPEYLEVSWDVMIQAVADGQYDVAADGITITAERAEIVDFSMGYVAIDQRLLVRAGEDRFDSIETLAADEAFILGTQVGTTNYETATEYLSEDRIQAYDQFPFAVQSLISGDIDAVIIDETAGLGYQGENSDALELIGPSIVSQELGFIYPKGSDLVDAFDAALQSMMDDGSLQAINAFYFGPTFDVTYDDIGDGAYAEEASDGPALGTEDNPLIWVLVPSEDSEKVISGADDIAAALEAETGLIVKTFVSTDFTGAVEAMCSGEAHIGALNTFNYLLASARGCANAGIVSVRFGATYYSGQLVTTEATGIESIADLAGKTFCRPDPTSTSGWVIPSIAMKAAGINPDTDLAEIVDAGGHDGVIKAVYEGDCDAGSSYVDARGTIEEDYPDVKDVVIVIAESAPIPNDNISYAPEVSAEDQAALTAFFLSLTETDEGLAMLEGVYNWGGLQAVEDSFYDGFRQQLEAAGLSIQELIDG